MNKEQGKTKEVGAHKGNVDKKREYALFQMLQAGVIDVTAAYYLIQDAVIRSFQERSFRGNEGLKEGSSEE